MELIKVTMAFSCSFYGSSKKKEKKKKKGTNMSHLAGCFIQGKQSLSHWLAENWTEWPNVIFEPTVTLKI